MQTYHTREGTAQAAPDLRSESVAARQLVEAMQTHGFDAEDIGLGLASETNLLEAVSATVRRLDELEELAGAAKALAARYVERSKALEHRRDLLREALTEALERSQAPMPLRLPDGTVSVKDTAPSAIVTDEEQIPDEFWRTRFTKSVDLRSLTLSLREGKSIPGASLRNSRRTIGVRKA